MLHNFQTAGNIFVNLQLNIHSLFNIPACGVPTALFLLLVLLFLLITVMLWIIYIKTIKPHKSPFHFTFSQSVSQKETKQHGTCTNAFLKCIFHLLTANYTFITILLVDISSLPCKNNKETIANSTSPLWNNMLREPSSSFLKSYPCCYTLLNTNMYLLLSC